MRPLKDWTLKYPTLKKLKLQTVVDCVNEKQQEQLTLQKQEFTKQFPYPKSDNLRP